MTTESDRVEDDHESTTALTEFTAATDNELDELKRLGIIMVEAGYFADAKAKGKYSTEVAKAIVKLMVGKELGLSPIAAMRGVFMTPGGAIGYSSNLIASAIKKSRRYDYRVITNTAEECTVAFFEGGDQVGESTWTMDDAKRAGLATKDNWKTYPAAMLFARALSAGSRMFAPDLFDGPAYTPEELSEGTPEEQLEAATVTVNAGTGEIIEPAQRPVQRGERRIVDDEAIDRDLTKSSRRLDAAIADRVTAENRAAAQAAAEQRERDEPIGDRFDDNPPLGD